jgi:hypothetical protein
MHQLGTVGRRQEVELRRKRVGFLSAETWHEVLFFSTVTISSTFNKNLTDQTKLFILGQESVPMCSVHRCTLHTMFDEECMCSLMFDEMLLRESMHFNQKFGCIEGFEDLGNQDRTSNLQIMLCGLRKK